MKRKHFLVRPGSRVRLADYPTNHTRGVSARTDAARLLLDNVRAIAEAQTKLYAQDRWSLLIIFQGMDAAGKDSTIKHVMSGVNPQGCQVYSFKAPSTEELDHDFLWRTATRLPERGRIGIFNRSYYEDTLVVRVHPKLLERERLPAGARNANIWRRRFEDINAFERRLHREGTTIIKFFLYVSKREQKKRFLARLDDKEKNWKFSVDDIREREHWGKYMRAYEDVIRRTAQPHAPWYVVPAGHKWIARLIVAEAIVQTLSAMKVAFPTLDRDARAKLKAARALLERQS